MSNHLVKKVKVPVHLKGDDDTPPLDFFLFYSFASGEYLMEKYGSPQAADKAFFSCFIKEENGKIAQKTQDEINGADLIRVLSAYVHALSMTWAKQNGVEPIDAMDLSIDDLTELMQAVAKAIGIAMPKSDGDSDPQKP